VWRTLPNGGLGGLTLATLLDDLSTSLGATIAGPYRINSR
jgi:hypothetical protein